MIDASWGTMLVQSEAVRNALQQRMLGPARTAVCDRMQLRIVTGVYQGGKKLYSASSPVQGGHFGN